MACDDHFADALNSGDDGCPDCAELLTSSRRLAAQLARVPRQAPPASIWEGLAGHVALARARQRAALVGGWMTGLAAAVLLVVLLQPLLTGPAAPATRTTGPRASAPPPVADPELAALQQNTDGLMLLAGLDH